MQGSLVQIQSLRAEKIRKLGQIAPGLSFFYSRFAHHPSFLAASVVPISQSKHVSLRDRWCLQQGLHTSTIAVWNDKWLK